MVSEVNSKLEETRWPNPWNAQQGSTKYQNYFSGNVPDSHPEGGRVCSFGIPVGTESMFSTFHWEWYTTHLMRSPIYCWHLVHSSMIGSSYPVIKR